jgi:hemerythrin-like domain-containing protein
MKGAYESFPLGLRLSHAALLRNVERFVAIADEEPTATADHLGDFVALYVAFLDVHHLGEDQFIFPALRRHSAGRSTDAAHLDRWSSEHREVHASARALEQVATRLRRSPREGLAELRTISIDLKELLVPHLSSEEEMLTGENLRAMIPEQELENEQRAIGKKMGLRGLQMGAFLAHSLAPHEQQAVFGEAPWFVRKLLLGFVGARRMVRFRPFVFEPSLTL